MWNQEAMDVKIVEPVETKENGSFLSIREF